MRPYPYARHYPSAKRYPSGDPGSLVDLARIGIALAPAAAAVAAAGYGGAYAASRVPRITDYFSSKSDIKRTSGSGSYGGPRVSPWYRRSSIGMRRVRFRRRRRVIRRGAYYPRRLR